MSDLRIQYTEELVGAGHPTKPDTINRLALAEHNPDGTHKNPDHTVKTAAYTLTAADDIIHADASGGPFTLSLPAGSVAGAGKQYVIVKIDGSLNAVTVSGSVDGQSTTALTYKDEVIIVQCDSTNYRRVNYESVAKRNLFINGNFDFWLRGTSFNLTGAVAYTADRFVVNSGNGSCTVSRGTFQLGQSYVPHEPRYYISINQTVAATNGLAKIAQKIEGVRTLAGKIATFSFYAKVSSGTLSVTPNASQDFGSGGIPSSPVPISGTAKTVTTTWQKFTETLSIPAINGKSTGSNDNDFLMFELTFPNSTTFTIDIAQWQVEEGPIATPFQIRPLGEEKALCQRYYEKSYKDEVVPGTVSENGRNRDYRQINTAIVQSAVRTVNFTVSKRADPNVTIYSPTTGASGKARDYTANVDVNGSAGSSSHQGFEWYANASGSSTVLNIGVQWVAESEL